MIPAAILNEQLKRVLPVVAHATPKNLATAMQTPYLTFVDSEHASITCAEMHKLGLVDEYGIVRTPFPVFRFCMEDHKGRVVFGCVQRDETGISIVAFHRYDGKVGPVMWAIKYKAAGEPLSGDLGFDGRLFDTRTLTDVTDFVEKTEAREKLPDKSDMSSISRDEAKRLIPKYVAEVTRQEQSLEISRGEIEVLKTVINMEAGAGLVEKIDPRQHQKSVFMALYNSILILCYEYLAPHNFTARVTPATQGKSVEWLRAREHYTVIHRHHAANNATVREGSTVTDNKHATRLAHSRRAHTKVLNHPRYKFKRGQTIFVRASWVGPKEWRDTAGQTYQILTERAPH